MKHLNLYIAAIFSSLLFISCRSGEKKYYGTTSTSGTITLMCDNSFENIMEQEISVFEYIYPKAHILARYIPQQDAIDSLMQGKSKAIVVARDLTKQERDYLTQKRYVVKSHKIAVDALALIVNPENTMDVITKEELSDILLGKVKNWNELEPNKTGDIKVVFDDESSSTVKYMRDSLMNGQKFGDNVFAQGSIQGVFDAVKQHKNAIGVIGVSWITSDMKQNISSEELTKQITDEAPSTVAQFDNSVKVLRVMNKSAVACKPYQQNIYDGSYPLFRQIYMIITSQNGTLQHGFYSFVTSRNGQKIILKTGIMPAVIQPQIVELVEPEQMQQ